MGSSIADTMHLIDDLRGRGEDFCVVTIVRTANATSAKAGAKAVVTGDGTLHGFVGGGCVMGAVRQVALEVLAAGEPRLIRVRPKEEVAGGTDSDGVELHRSSCPSGGTVELFLEPTVKRMRVVICGASPVAATLARLARSMGYVTIVAALEADHDRVDAADERIDGFDLTSLALTRNDAVVVATQGKRDREALANALRSGAGYVGMVGSRTKIRTLLDQLSDDISGDEKRALHGPAGLDIGAIEPEEIALSIIGEMIQKRRRSLKDQPGKETTAAT